VSVAVAKGAESGVPRTNPEWLAALRASGAEQAAAVADLRAYVLRAATHALRRRRATFGVLASTDIAQLAEDCAQNAVVAILQHLDAFRGESRFTTWAYSFAINTALTAARHERWRHVSLDDVVDDRRLDDWTRADGRAPADPHHLTLQRETLAVVRDAIEHHLSDRQRHALSAIFFEGVPPDELARHWGSNRNAVYKLLHDARRKLKARLEEAGFSVPETLAVFGGHG
jgi:RNA polymerase sigma-70 factor (ECF subfamily)